MPKHAAETALYQNQSLFFLMRQSSCWLHEKQQWSMGELDMPLENYNAKQILVFISVWENGKFWIKQDTSKRAQSQRKQITKSIMGQSALLIMEIQSIPSFWDFSPKNLHPKFNEFNERLSINVLNRHWNRCTPQPHVSSSVLSKSHC